MKDLKPKSIVATNDGTYIVDFGQEITGWVETSVNHPAKEVVFRLSEPLQKGEFYIDNLRTAKQEFKLIDVLTNTHINPHFTFFGFRYVEVNGLYYNDVKNLIAYSIYTEMDELFEFNSSHEGMNKLMSNICWSQKDNFFRYSN